MAQFEAAAVSRLPRTSSRGSLRPSLRGRLCVVGGGSDAVGSGIIRALLLEGATVVAPLQHQRDIEQLRHECAGAPMDKLLLAVVDVGNEGEYAQFVSDVVGSSGRIDHAVSCFGSLWQGGMLTDQSLPELYRVFADCTASHFVFCKHVLPAMKYDSTASMLILTGPQGERCESAEASLATVAAGALYGVIQAAQAQYADHPLRINEMRLYTGIKRHSELGSRHFQDFWGKKVYSNRKLGRLAVDALLASKKCERFSVTPEGLDGVTLTV